jgi:hypothetical protein
MTGWYDFSPGIATLFIFLLLASGMNLVGMGILGAYIGRIYEEAKDRPKFIVESAIGAPARITYSQPRSEVLTNARGG